MDIYKFHLSTEQANIRYQDSIVTGIIQVIIDDANLNIHILLDVIREEQRDLGYLPEVGYLQMDGARDNKNRWMLTTRAVMVGASLFRKCKVSFLPKGHTHEDIDQLFSRFAEFLRHHDILCIDDLIRYLADAVQCEKKYPIVKRVTHTYDYKQLVDPVLQPMRQHSVPMCFKFELNDSKDAVLMFARSNMHTKKAEDPECWFPADGFHICTCEEARALWDADVKQIQPRDIAVSHIDNTVQQFVKMNLMNDAQKACWQREIEDIVNRLDARCARALTHISTITHTTHIIILFTYAGV